MNIAKKEALTNLNEDEKSFFEMVSDFSKSDIQPLVKKMDAENKIDPSLIPRFFEIGLMGIEIPEEYEGSGASFMMAVLAVQALAQVDPSMSVVIDVQNTLVNNAIIKWGSSELKKRYLVELATNKIGSYCLSESSSGSDAFALKLKAKKKGGLLYSQWK